MNSVLCLEDTKSSALRRIALTAKTIDCWDGVPGGGDPVIGQKSSHVACPPPMIEVEASKNRLVDSCC